MALIMDLCKRKNVILGFQSGSSIAGRFWTRPSFMNRGTIPADARIAGGYYVDCIRQINAMITGEYPEIQQVLSQGTASGLKVER